MNALRPAVAMVSCDVRMQLRRPVALGSALTFSLTALVTMHLTLAGNGRVAPEVAAGALWLVLLFAAQLCSGRSLSGERDDGTFAALLLAPVDRSVLYLAKSLGSLLHLAVVHALVVLLFLALFHSPVDATAALQLAATVALAGIGFAAAGVLVSSICMRARAPEMVAAVVYTPVVLPMVIVAAAVTLGCFDPAAAGDAARQLSFLAMYDCVVMLLGAALFPLAATE